MTSTPQPTSTTLDPLPYLPKHPSALTAALETTDLTLTPAILRPHPTYAHEILLVRPPGLAAADWALPARIVPATSPDRIAAALRTAVAQDTGLELRGVVGGGVLEGPPRRASSSAASASAASVGSGSGASSPAPPARSVGVYYVVMAEGEASVDARLYSEWMWAKAAEVPALQLRSDVKRTVLRAFEVANATP